MLVQFKSKVHDKLIYIINLFLNFKQIIEVTKKLQI